MAAFEDELPNLNTTSSSFSEDQEIWGKEVTIIEVDATENISRKYHTHQYQQLGGNKPTGGNDYGICQNQVHTLAEQNEELLEYIQELQEKLETTELDLGICKADFKGYNPDEIYPYFYNDNYLTKDSKTIITRGEWSIVVWLAGKGDDELILYPLGDQKTARLDITQIKDIIFDLSNNKGWVGTAYGKTYMKRGHPIIEFTEIVDVDGNDVPVSRLPLPVLFQSRA